MILSIDMVPHVVAVGATKAALWRARRWEFKAQHFDSVMLFKMGKFYEMFEMDAHVGAEVLGLMYMKARQLSPQSYPATTCSL